MSMSQQLPRIKQLFRETTSGAPRPVHADLLGVSGEIVEQGDVRLPLLANGQYTAFPAFRPTADSTLIREALRLLAVLTPNRERQGWNENVREYVRDWHAAIRPHLTS